MKLALTAVALTFVASAALAEVDVVDARGKLIGQWVPGTFTSVGAVAIDFGSGPDAFPLTLDDDPTLTGPTFWNGYFAYFLQTDCKGPAYLQATFALPIGWFDGTNLWYPARPFQRVTVLSEDYAGSCFNLPVSGSPPKAGFDTLVGLARSVPLAKLNFRTPYSVKINNNSLISIGN